MGVASTRGLDPFPRADLAGLPVGVRQAIHRRGRAIAALHVYKRRGWNRTGVQAELLRAGEHLREQLELAEFAEQNPTLF